MFVDVYLVRSEGTCLFNRLRFWRNCIAHLIHGKLALVGIFDWLYNIGPVPSQVLEFHNASLAFHNLDDLFGDPALVKSVLPVSGNLTEGLRKGGESLELSREWSASVEKHFAPIWRCFPNALL